jgi:outer membrane protein OmpA-like peptidoglycan-associated protein
MKRHKQQSMRVGSAAVAAVALTAGVLAPGCWDNRLPARELPSEEAQRPLPRWYPERAWSEKGGESQVFIEGKIVFDTNKAIIRPGSEKVLKTLHQFMNEHTEVTRLRIEGHTDARASEEHNMDLSAKRALAVANWLVDNGVDPIRLIAVGFGESKPLAPNVLAEGRADNRRTEFHVAEVNGRPFLGKDPYAGGFALDVLSTEERKKRAAEAVAQRVIPPPPTYKATGDEVKEFDRKKREQELKKRGGPENQAPTPAKEGAPGGQGAAPPAGPPAGGG